MRFIVRRFVNGEPVTEDELSDYTITDKTVLDIVKNAIQRNNERSSQKLENAS